MALMPADGDTGNAPPPFPLPRRDVAPAVPPPLLAAIDADSACAVRDYVGYGQTFTPAAFPVSTPEGVWSASSLVFNASFDAATLTLSSAYHALGDCGTAGSWVWSSDASYLGWSFALKQFRMREKCDVEPGEMSITYQAKP